MYEVYADGNLIHYSGDDECILINPKIKSALNDAGSFEFGISPLHEFYDAIKRRRTIVSVLENGKEIFCGEVREENKSGNLKKQVYCVGELAFLYDSIQPQAEYHDISPRDLLEVWLDIHNSQMTEESKRFYVGIVTVHDTNDSLYRFTNYESTLDAIKEKLVGKLGGYLKVRKVNGKKYLDWLTIETYGKICEQAVEFGENLLDYSENTTASDICTALIPLGARIEESEDSGEEDSVPQTLEKYVNITSVNGGSDCIKLDDAVREYGFICKVVHWEDVHIPSNLLEKGKQWLIDNQYESMTLKIKALDMSRYSENFDEWELGDRVRVKADIYGMDRIFPVSEMEILLDSPENNVLILGNTIKTISGNSNSISGKIQEESEKNYQRTQWLQNAIDNATQMLTGSKGGYKLSEYDENGLWVRDLYMDAPSKDDAQNIIQINMNGIGFSRTGYDGPYLNAWTIDGTFLGEFIKAHSIKAEALETEYIEKVEKQISDAETGAKEYVDDKITTKVSALESHITLSVETERDRASGVEEELLSKINVTQGNITSEVSRATSAESNLSSRITQTESSISSEITRAKNAESELSSKITQTENSISSFVSSDEVSSMIEQKADSIRLKASKIAWSSTYSSMTSDGVFTCQKATIKGTLQTSSVKILDDQITLYDGSTLIGKIIYQKNQTVYDNGTVGTAHLLSIRAADDLLIKADRMYMTTGGNINRGITKTFKVWEEGGNIDNLLRLKFVNGVLVGY